MQSQTKPNTSMPYKIDYRRTFFIMKCFIDFQGRKRPDNTNRNLELSEEEPTDIDRSSVAEEAGDRPI